MKTNIVPPDFSDFEMKAEDYTLQFAKYVEANMALCNAFFIPTSEPTPGSLTTDPYDYDTLKADNAMALKAVVKLMPTR